MALREKDVRSVSVFAIIILVEFAQGDWAFSQSGADGESKAGKETRGSGREISTRPRPIAITFECP
jgi:hypothetical protein